MTKEGTERLGVFLIGLFVFVTWLVYPLIINFRYPGRHSVVNARPPFDNACVIEFKKCGVNKGRDAAKLQAFTSLGDVFQYKCGSAIRLGKTLPETEVDMWYDGVCHHKHILVCDFTSENSFANMCSKVLGSCENMKFCRSELKN